MIDAKTLEVLNSVTCSDAHPGGILWQRRGDGEGGVLVLWSLDRVHARDLIIIIFIGVILNALLVLLDCLAEQFETHVGVALVLTLVEVGGRVPLKFLLDPDKVLLCMGADLCSRSRHHEFLYAFPVFAEVLERYKCKGLGICKDLLTNLAYLERTFYAPPWSTCPWSFP